MFWSSDVCSSELSFHAAGIDLVKALDPSIRTVYLTASEPGAEAALDHAIQQGHEIVAPSHNLSELDAAYVDRAHAGGHKIVPWTVNRRSDMLRLMQLDIDGVISDFTGCALQMQSRTARSEEHTSELQSLMRISSAAFCLTKQQKN